MNPGLFGLPSGKHFQGLVAFTSSGVFTTPRKWKRMGIIGIAGGNSGGSSSFGTLVTFTALAGTIGAGSFNIDGGGINCIYYNNDGVRYGAGTSSGAPYPGELITDCVPGSKHNVTIGSAGGGGNPGIILVQCIQTED